jgi:hypothetical protein
MVRNPAAQLLVIAGLMAVEGQRQQPGPERHSGTEEEALNRKT